MDIHKRKKGRDKKEKGDREIKEKGKEGETESTWGIKEKEEVYTGSRKMCQHSPKRQGVNGHPRPRNTWARYLHFLFYLIELAV